MVWNRFNSTLMGLVLLWAILCSVPALGGETQPAQPVYEIHFGIIEPPVVAQKDITVGAPTSNRQKEEKPLECSGLAWLNGTLLIASDRHEHLIFSCPVDLNTMTFDTPQPCVVIPNERDLVQDAESLTVRESNGRFNLYMMSSLSNAPNAQPLPQRRQMLWGLVKQSSPFELEHSAVIPVGTIRQQVEACFEKIKVQPYSTYFIDYPGENKNTYRWGNVEGMTFTPSGQSLLCGMRNPLFDRAAILFVVSGMVRTNVLSQTESLEVTDFFLLDLEDRGVSDLAWDPVTQGYLITAAKSGGPRRDSDQAFPPTSLDSALFWWNGHKTDKPILVARIPDMTIEAVCRLGTSRYIVLGSDEGDVSEGRTARQSILTVLEFTGIQRGPG
jgi:hypothetical protein